jgi:hypothetical protein
VSSINEAKKTGIRRVLVGVAVAGLLTFVAQPVAAEESSADPDGCGYEPTLSCQWGDGHRLDAYLVNRSRVEGWNARGRGPTGGVTTSWGIRNRIGATYSYRKAVKLFGEFQNARVFDLSGSSTGAEALYKANVKTTDGRIARGDDVRQLWLQLDPVEDLSIRGGRQDIKLGTEVMYSEPSWKYLKVKRASQRLVGTVGWTHAERSNDGLGVAYDLGEDHHLYGFWARPTTGVFDLRKGYRQQDDINYGGVTWTVKRDTWIPDTELRFFGLVYDDDRPVEDGGRADDVEVYTLGFSTIGIYPLGPGNMDLLVWFAYQAGDYTAAGGTSDLDLNAAAGILEVGYQLPEVYGKPWFRLGVNVASGDDDPDDGDSTTFFNMLPTNHLYYGFADQLAFQNLVDWFAQIMFWPHEKVLVNLMFHQFDLQNDDDSQYFGTGAFNKNAFGFGQRPSAGSKRVARELDVVVNVNLIDHVSLQGGYAYMWGRTSWERQFSNEDVKFAYGQVTVSY